MINFALALLIIIILVGSSICLFYLRLKYRWYKWGKEDSELIKNEQEKFNTLDDQGKLKYKIGKKRTLEISMLLSMIPICVFMIYGNILSSDQITISIVLIGFLYVISLLLSYMVIDDYKRRKGKYF